MTPIKEISDWNGLIIFLAFHFLTEVDVGEMKGLGGGAIITQSDKPSVLCECYGCCSASTV